MTSRTPLGIFIVLLSAMSALPLAAQITTYPYSENFDTAPNPTTATQPGAEPNPDTLVSGWTQDPTDVATQDWYARVNATGSTGTGPSADHTSGSGVYLFVEDGFGNHADVGLLSPVFDVSGLSAPEMTFWYHSNSNTTTNNELHIDVIDSLGTTLDVITAIGSVGNFWAQETVSLSGYTGNVQVRFRVDNSTTSFQHDIAIDDVAVVDVVDQLVVTPGTISGLAAAGDVDKELGAFELEALATSNQSITAITVLKTGTVLDADVSNVKLWHDQNGNGIVDGTDVQIGSTVATLSGSSTATFSGGPNLLVVTAGTSEFVVVTADLAATVGGGEAIGFNLAASTDVSATPGPITGTFPVNGGSLPTVLFSSSLPYLEDFDGGSLATNAQIFSAAGTYPTSTAVGATPGSATVPSNATLAILSTSTIGNISARSGTGYFYSAHNTGGSVAGLDFFFDLSAFNAATNKIELRFAWNDDGMDTTTTYTQHCYAFISVDGGATWVTTLFDIDTSATTSFWADAVVDVSAALTAASSNFSNRVVIRLQGSDNLSSDQLGFEDVILREVPTQLEVGGRTLAPSPFAIRRAGDVVVLDPTLVAQVANQTVSDITVNNTGSVADSDISAVKLWQDNNGDSALDAGDTQLGTNQTFTGGTATFAALALAVTAGTPVDLLVTYEFAATASGTVGCSIDTGDVVATPGPVAALFPQTFPVGFTLGTLVQYTAALPFSEDFEATVATNVAAQIEPGTYPTATAIGGTTATAASPGTGLLSVGGTFNGTVPNNGTGQAIFNWLNLTQATVALDFHFDLSAYNVNNDQLEFSFAWNDDGLDGGTTNEPFDYVFISTDGGANWLTALYYIDPDVTTSTVSNTYTNVVVDVSQILQSVGGNFTNQTVVRLQVADNDDADALLVDDILLELIPPTAPTIADPAATGGSAAVMITELAEDPGASGNEFIEITNVGGAPIDITGWQMYVWEGGATGAPTQSATVGSVILAAGQTFLFADVTTDATYTVDAYLGSNILDFDDAGCVLLDASNAIVDAAFFGPIDPTLITTPVVIGAEWVGATGSAPLFNGPSQERVGTSDSNDATDWVASSTLPDNDSIGVANTGLTLPWSTNVPALVISGANPTYTATVELGGDLNFSATANDVNTIDSLTWTVTDLATGSLTAAQAGFDQVFTANVYNDPNPGQSPPHSIDLTGIAQQLGTVNLQLEVSDGTFTTAITLSITIQAGSPLVRVRNVGTMDFFTYAIGTPSALEDTFEVSGYSLTNDIVVTAPTDFEVSTTSGSGFSGSVTLIPAGGQVAQTTVFVRYNPTTAGPHSQTVNITSTGANNDSFSVDGQIIPPAAPSLSGPVTPTTGAPILITEMASDPGTSGNEFIEITNVSNAPVDITGWTMYAWEGSTGAPTHTAVVLSVVLPAGGTFLFADVTTDASFTVGAGGYLGSNVLDWIDAGAVLTDNLGTIVDAAFFGTVDPALISTPFTIGAEWSGVTATGPLVGGPSQERTGTSDNNVASDWVASTNPPTNDSTGVANPGLSLPMTGLLGSGFVTISGTAPNFTAETFVGDDLELNFDADDTNVLETLTFTITNTSGSLTAAQAGFNEVFTAGVYNDPAPGVAPHSLQLTGMAAMAGTISLLVEVSDGALTDSYTIDLTINATPTILATANFNPFFAPATATPSPEQSYTVEGTALLSDITIDAPTEFEISTTSGAGFGSQVVLVPTGGIITPTTIFVRYNPSGTGPDLGDIAHTAQFATQVDVAVEGYVGPPPSLTVTGTPLMTFSTNNFGSPSNEQSFNVNGTGVVADVIVTAPANFEVSLSSGTGFAGSVTITHAGGAFPTTTVFVRYVPAMGTGTSHTGNITITTAGPASTNVAVDGVITGGGSSSGSGSGSDGGGGCVTSTSNGMWGLLLGVAAMLVLALRVRAVRENHA